MKKLIIFCGLLLGINSYSQSTDEEKYLAQAEASINDETYTALLKEVVEFRLSDDYLNEIYYNKSFIDKIGSVENSKETCSLNDKDFEIWISKNLNKTKFTSAKDALETFVNYNKYSKLNVKKNLELNLKLDQYKQKYGLLIDQEFRTSLAKAENNAFNKRFKS